LQPDFPAPVVGVDEESEADGDDLTIGVDDGCDYDDDDNEDDDGDDEDAEDPGKSSLLDWTDDDEAEKATSFVNLGSDLDSDDAVERAEDPAPAAGVGGKRKVAPGGASASEPAMEQPVKKKKMQTVAKPARKRKKLPVEDGYDAFFILPLSFLTLLFLSFLCFFRFLLR